MPIRAILLLVAFAAQLTDVRDVMRLGRTQDEALFASWTKGYQLTASDPVAGAEIITEFRRAVLIVRDHMHRAEVGFTEHELGVEMKPFLGQVGFIVTVNLHPLNTYTKLPEYDLYVSSGARSSPIAAAIKRDPIYALGGPGASLVGVRLEVTLPRAELAAAPAPELIVTNEKADVLWRGAIDLTRYR
jgi:hypothetical protein